MAYRSALSTPGNEVSPSSGTVNQTANVRQSWVRVADIQLVVPKLSREPAGHVGFQVTDVPAMIEQMG